MRFWICLLLLLSVNAYATPADENQPLVLTPSPLLSQLQTLRHDVTERTSELVSVAMGFIGVPYRRGGTNADTGLDCSGFVRVVFEEAKGLVLPRVARDQAANTEKIDKKDLQPGDLVFFNTMRRAFSHVGIYLGDGKFIHSPRSGAKVRIEDMGASYWSKRFNGARRVTQGEADTLTAAASAAPFAQDR